MRPATNREDAAPRLGEDTRPLIGIVAIQGDVSEHEAALRRAGADVRWVRRPEDLAGLDGLVIPGGESTTIGQLAEEFGLIEAVRRLLERELPVWGTCAGMVLLANDVGRDQPLIGGIDLYVDRNAFGRQVDSFETDLSIVGLHGGPFRAVFIRAPAATRAGDDVDVLAALEDGRIVAARSGNRLVTAFHPELTDDDRLHRMFVEMVRGSGG